MICRTVSCIFRNKVWSKVNINQLPHNTKWQLSSHYYTNNPEHTNHSSERTKHTDDLNKGYHISNCERKLVRGKDNTSFSCTSLSAIHLGSTLLVCYRHFQYPKLLFVQQIPSRITFLWLISRTTVLHLSAYTRSLFFVESLTRNLREKSLICPLELSFLPYQSFVD